MTTKLYVGGFSSDTSEDQLKETLGEHGQVTSVVILKDRDTGNSRGFGFVEMPDFKEAQAAIKALNGQEKNGKTLVVSVARQNNPPGHGGGFRR